jgi:O-methyltransferase involved in polyketide biosynthesis
MIISDTSALVLNWTSKDIWKSKNAQNYFAGLDLNAADILLQKFNRQENYMHTQMVSNRKFFIRKSSIEFLEECRRNGRTGQVIILAAGIAPLSVEIASLYKESKVFDVDKYLMKDKERYLDNVCPNINFIECDITDIKLLKEKLLEKGWNIKEPGLLIMEGIIYYLTEDDLKNLFTFFSGNNFKLACDFGLKPECVNEKNRIYGVEVFRKIQESVGLEFVSFDRPDYYMSLVTQCGFENATRFTMDDIQKERTGEKSPFDYDEPGWIAVVKN